MNGYVKTFKVKDVDKDKNIELNALPVNDD